MLASLVLFLGCAETSLVSKTQTTLDKPAKLRFGEYPLRQIATRRVKPVYPEEAARSNSQGVAIAELEINENGRVSTVRVLQSPHEAISAAVSEAVKQWSFRPQTIDKSPVSIVGRLTFYFRMEDSIPKVLNPDEVPVRRERVNSPS
jgi:TonB family protein